MTANPEPPVSAAPPLLATSELRYLVLAAQREGSRTLSRRLAAFNLTVSQAEILLVLDEFGPLTLKNLGELIVCEAGSPSRIVETLVGRSLVARETDASDRRAVLLQLSEAGAELIPALREIDSETDVTANAIFTPDERRAIASALRRFLGHTPSGPILEHRFAAKRGPIE